MTLKSKDGKGVVEAGLTRAEFEGALVSAFPVKIGEPIVVALTDELLNGSGAQA
jgi:hypothetical protein